MAPPTTARKLRKKLRQIENLENLNRPLNSEEIYKVSRKNEVRSKLLELVEYEEIEVGRGEGVDEGEGVVEGEGVEGPPLVDLSSADHHDHDHDHHDTRQLPKVHVEVEEGKTSNRKDGKIKDQSESKQSGVAAAKAQRDRGDSCRDWRKDVFSMNVLPGHGDIVYSVAADGDLIVSCSRDTTVKVWDGATGEETQNLRGHSGSVTCLVLLTAEESEELGRYMRRSGGGGGGGSPCCRVAITGGTDCTVRMWDVLNGTELKSFYTFNEITSLGFVACETCIVTGTEGGKLELWDAITSENLQSLTTFEDCLTAIRVSGRNVYTASPEGFVHVFEIGNRELSLVFSSEDLFRRKGDAPVPHLIPRHIRSLEVVGDVVFYGDDGVNVKALDWKARTVKKLTNHLCEFGSTDSIFSTGKEIVCTSYDLDDSYGNLNIRKLPNGEYLASLGDGQCGRILSVACTRTKSGLPRFVTGGIDLRVWEAVGTALPPPGGYEAEGHLTFVKTSYVPDYARKAHNSDLESSETETESDPASDDECNEDERTYVPREVTARRGFWRFCSIL